MSSVNVPGYARKPPIVARHIQNGPSFSPDATVMTYMEEEANRIAALRPKSWAFTCPLAAIPASGGASRARWRFALHTSPMVSFAWVRVGAAPASPAVDPQISVRFVKDGSLLVNAEATFHIGAHAGADVPENIAVQTTPTNNGDTIVELEPDTRYTVTVYDVNDARCQSVAVWESTKPADTDYGYIASGKVAGSPILDDDRGELIPLLHRLWKEQGAPLLSWSSNTDADAPTLGTHTTRNLIDPSISIVDDSSPGAFLQLAYHSTLRRQTVPCVMRVYGKCTGGTGHVYLVDATGTRVADVAIDDPTADWFETTCDLTAEDAKLDPQFEGVDLQTLTVYAVSLYQHED